MKKTKSIYLNLIFIILYWVILQDFVLAIIYKFTGSTLITKLLFYSKDVLFILLFIYSFFKFRFPSFLFWSILIYLSLVLLNFGISVFVQGLPLLSVLQSVRNVILLPCFLCIGFGVKFNDALKARIDKYIKFILICTLFGYLDYFLDVTVGTKGFWTGFVGITEFYSDIKGQAGRLVHGLPGNFYGQYGQEFFSVKRFVGLWMGPLTAAYILLLPALYYYIKLLNDFRSNSSSQRKTDHFAIVLYTLLAIYLTHTRAIILVLAVAFYVLTFIYVKRKYRGHIILLSVLVAAIGYLAMYDKIQAFLFDGSTAGHISSIKNSLNSIDMSLVGNGFGNFGIVGDVGTENVYLTILGNQGVISVLLFAVIFIIPIIACLKSSSKELIVIVTVCAGLCYFMTGMVSEQLSAYTSIAPFYILLGVSYRYTYPKSVKPCKRKILLYGEEILVK